MEFLELVFKFTEYALAATIALTLVGGVVFLVGCGYQAMMRFVDLAGWEVISRVVLAIVIITLAIALVIANQPS